MYMLLINDLSNHGVYILALTIVNSFFKKVYPPLFVFLEGQILTLVFSVPAIDVCRRPIISKPWPYNIYNLPNKTINKSLLFIICLFLYCPEQSWIMAFPKRLCNLNTRIIFLILENNCFNNNSKRAVIFQMASNQLK